MTNTHPSLREEFEKEFSLAHEPSEQPNGTIEEIFNWFRDHVIEKVEDLRKDVRVEENDPEIKVLMKRIWGKDKTPEYMVERRTGFNAALDSVKRLFE